MSCHGITLTHCPDFTHISVIYYGRVPTPPYIIDLTKHQNKTSFLLNGHKHPTCLKRQVM